MPGSFYYSRNLGLGKLVPRGTRDSTLGLWSFLKLGLGLALSFLGTSQLCYARGVRGLYPLRCHFFNMIPGSVYSSLAPFPVRRGFVETGMPVGDVW